MGTSAILRLGEIIQLPVDGIGPNPYQPRKAFEREPLEELAQSIRQYGVMQPISVRCINGAAYELVAGERRLRASRLAGLETIPAVVVTVTDKDSAALALIENLQRENLNYLEEAEGYTNLISDYSYTQEQLAERIGKSQSTIANKLRILKLSPQIQKSLIANSLSERHARALLRLPDEEAQLAILEKIVEDGLNVKKTEELVEETVSGRNAACGPPEHEVNDENAERRAKRRVRPYAKDLRLFMNTVRQAVGIMNDSGVNAVCDVENRADGCFIKIVVTY